MSLIRKKPFPRFRLWLLEKLYALSLGEGFSGDLEEDWLHALDREGWQAANRWLWSQTLVSFPVFLQLYLHWGWAMLVNHMKVFIRNLTRHKSSSFIHLTGLALGMAVFLVILLFVRNERQFDTFHRDHGRLFRLVSGNPADKDSYAGSPAPLGPELHAAFPEIDAFVRFDLWPHVVKYSDKNYREPRVLLADSTFFSVFSFPLIQGDANTVLMNPNAVVITESTVRKYFGDRDPLGEVLHFSGRGDFIVQGIAKDVPATSHFHFDFVIPFRHVGGNVGWGAWNYFTFVRFNRNIDKQALKNKVDAFFEGRELGDITKRVYYQPITDIHFQYNRSNLEPAFNGHFLLIFQGVAFTVLLMACLNYVNLSTAYAQRRAKEVGVKKSVGVSRREVMRQFLHESVFMALLAECTALGLVTLTLPLVNRFAGRMMVIPWHDTVFILGIAGLGILVGLLAGVYPAFVLARYQPAQVLKGRLGTQKRSKLRAVLVVVQFVAAIMLIAGTLFIHRQMNYIQSRDLGYNKEAVVALTLNRDLRQRSPEFRHAFLGLADVSAASVNSHVPNEISWCQSVYWEGQTEDQATTMYLFSADAHYFETMEMRLLEGMERISRHQPVEGQSAYVLNQAALAQIGWEGAEGRRFDLNDNPLQGEVIGVAENFHYRSLHHKVAPLAIYITPYGKRLNLRLTPGRIAPAMAQIRRLWKTLAPGFELEYEFVDDKVAASYRSEQQLGQLLNLFTIITLFIACLGLMSLASFTAAQRTKEIGIRRVLGASITGITLRLTRDFVAWVLLANAIAWPLAWWGVRAWLEQFEYRMTVPLSVFLFAGLGALVIALISVGYQTVKAAMANPVKSLKYE